jgi:ribosomal protein S18 acetylase RimI-like enzyme
VDEIVVDRAGTVADAAAHLGRLTVAREASGKGIDAELLIEASRLAAERGFAYVRLDCPAENVGLRRYYVEAGYSYIRRCAYPRSER